MSILTDYYCARHAIFDAFNCPCLPEHYRIVSRIGMFWSICDSVIRSSDDRMFTRDVCSGVQRFAHGKPMIYRAIVDGEDLSLVICDDDRALIFASKMEITENSGL